MLSRTHAAGSNGSKLFDCDSLAYLGACRSLSPLETLAPGAALVLIYFSATIPLHPFSNLPFHDDRTYAWSAYTVYLSEQLLKLRGIQNNRPANAGVMSCYPMETQK